MNRFIQWLAWVFSNDYMAIGLVVSGLLVLIGVSAWQERDFTYAVIPFILAAASTVYFTYKQTSRPNENPALRVERVLSMDVQEKGSRSTVTAEVVLCDTDPCTVYVATLDTASPVGGHAWIAAVIESVRTVKMTRSDYRASWDTPCVPHEARTPHGRLTLREKAIRTQPRP